jgi:hypothetical protein
MSEIRSQLAIFVTAALFFATLPLSRGQDAAPAIVDLPTEKTQTPAPSPSPSAMPEVPELSQLDQAFKQSSLGKAADEYRVRVEWRRLQNLVADEPAVVTAKAAAQSARTDLEKRDRLRDYYNIYYGRMRALASSDEMRKALDTFKAEHLKLLDQPRVRPAPGASATFDPKAEKEKHKKDKHSRFGR